MSKKNGYTACTANYMKGFIAAAEYGLSPDIHIYKYPGNQLVAKIKAETTIQCTDLVFSRDCTRLLMIGDKPDYKISIYDIEEKRMLTINETLKDKMYLTSGFNPADPNQFFVASPQNLTFYTIIGNSYTITKENEESSISKSERVNSMIFAPENPETIYKDIIWDPYSKLYIATDQKVVHQIDFNTGEEKMKISLEDVPRNLILTQRHLIVALDNKRVLWYSALPPEERITSQQVLQKDKLIQLQDEITQEYVFENGGIKYMRYTKNFKKIVFGCEDGFLATLSVEAELYNEEEEDDDERSVKEMKTINTPLSELGKYHTKTINGIKELGETTQVVTVSDDHYL